MHVSFYCMFLYPACYAMLPYAINAFIHTQLRPFKPIQPRSSNDCPYKLTNPHSLSACNWLCAAVCK